MRQFAPSWYRASRVLPRAEQRIVECIATVFIVFRKTLKNCGTTPEAISTLQKMTAVFKDPEDLQAQYAIAQDFPDFEIAVRAWKELSLFLGVAIPAEYFIEHLMGLETEIRRIRPQTEAELFLNLYRLYGTIALAAGHALNVNERALPALADLATGYALRDFMNFKVGFESAFPLNWTGRENQERQRLASLFLASSRQALSSLPLRLRLFVFLPIRIGAVDSRTRSLRALDQALDEAISLAIAGFKQPKMTILSKPASVIDAALVVRNQMTRVGLYNSAHTKPTPPVSEVIESP